MKVSIPSSYYLVLAEVVGCNSLQENDIHMPKNQHFKRDRQQDRMLGYNHFFSQAKQDDQEVKGPIVFSSHQQVFKSSQSSRDNGRSSDSELDSVNIGHNSIIQTGKNSTADLNNTAILTTSIHGTHKSKSTEEANAPLANVESSAYFTIHHSSGSQLHDGSDGSISPSYNRVENGGEINNVTVQNNEIANENGIVVSGTVFGPSNGFFATSPMASTKPKRPTQSTAPNSADYMLFLPNENDDDYEERAKAIDVDDETELIEEDFQADDVMEIALTDDRYITPIAIVTAATNDGGKEGDDCHPDMHMFRPKPTKRQKSNKNSSGFTKSKSSKLWLGAGDERTWRQGDDWIKSIDWYDDFDYDLGQLSDDSTKKNGHKRRKMYNGYDGPWGHDTFWVQDTGPGWDGWHDSSDSVLSWGEWVLNKGSKGGKGGKGRRRKHGKSIDWSGRSQGSWGNWESEGRLKCGGRERRPTTISSGSNPPSVTTMPSIVPTIDSTRTPSSLPSRSPTRARDPRSQQPTTEKKTDPPTISIQINPPTLFPIISPTSAQPTTSPVPSPTQGPSKSPSEQPTSSPTHGPSKSPSERPTSLLTLSPSKSPSNQPTPSPTPSPSKSPSNQPTFSPTPSPSKSPSKQPTSSPTQSPSKIPSKQPTSSPTLSPSNSPSKQPTSSPTLNPSKSPSKQPTSSPTQGPSKSPSERPTSLPTLSPSKSPSKQPTPSPTFSPSKRPSNQPTPSPTSSPSKSPSKQPTSSPTQGPSKSPSERPTSSPTLSPSNSPSKQPTSSPTFSPSKSPSNQPTPSPTPSPSKSPSERPTSSPTQGPSMSPSERPTSLPTLSPSNSPSKQPTSSPTFSPSKSPSNQPTPSPTSSPSKSPSKQPTSSPTQGPSKSPSERPTSLPTLSPSKSPSKQPTLSPTFSPSKSPSNQPTPSPTPSPSKSPSKQPTSSPTQSPSMSPSKQPTSSPTLHPSKSPSKQPTSSPSQSPSKSPSKQPTSLPTQGPSKSPSKQPTSLPTQGPSKSPSKQPTFSPTKSPTKPENTPEPTLSDLDTYVPTPEPTPVFPVCDGSTIPGPFPELTPDCFEFSSVVTFVTVFDTNVHPFHYVEVTVENYHSHTSPSKLGDLRGVFFDCSTGVNVKHLQISIVELVSNDGSIITPIRGGYACNTDGRFKDLSQDVNVNGPCKADYTCAVETGSSGANPDDVGKVTFRILLNDRDFTTNNCPGTSHLGLRHTSVTNAEGGARNESTKSRGVLDCI